MYGEKSYLAYNLNPLVADQEKVKELELSKKGHKILFEKESNEFRAEAKWIVDSTGRNSLMKRKLGLKKKL